MSKCKSTGAHILVYPFPSLGHIIPFLDLTHRFLTRGLKVTVLITPDNLHLLDPLRSRHESSSLQPLVLSAIDRSTTPRLVAALRLLRELHYPALLQWFQSQASPPVAIFSDFFLGWTQSLASELGVPRVLFSPSGSSAISLNISMCREPPKIDDPEDVNRTFSFLRVPNSPEYALYQITYIYRAKDGDPEKEFYRKNWLENIESWGVVLNSFADFESIYIDHLKKEMGHDRVWAVGPVIPVEDDGDDGALDPTNRGGPSSVAYHELMSWLDAKEVNSVVYVCFGSRQVLTQKQTDELAKGLEQSGVNFVWSVREPKVGQVSAGGDHGVIPEGFEDRVAGKGFLIKGWAPQVAILKHGAVGVFLTHCGWNSTLEGIMAGVVMLTWPMCADQFNNAKLLVDQCGVGIRVGESTQNVPEPRKLSRVLVESLDGSRPERIRAQSLREAALKAVKGGGSSDKDLDLLLKAVNELKV